MKNSTLSVFTDHYLLKASQSINIILRPVVTIKVFLVKVFEGFLTVTTVKENFDQKL
jgi:hypothetical protein